LTLQGTSEDIIFNGLGLQGMWLDYMYNFFLKKLL